MLQLELGTSAASRGLLFLASYLNLVGSGSVRVVRRITSGLLLRTPTSSFAQPATIAKALVAARDAASPLLGEGSMEQAKVSFWLARSLAEEDAELAAANAALFHSSYLAGARLTVADVLLFHRLHPRVAAKPTTELASSFPSLVRWCRQVEADIARTAVVAPVAKAVALSTARAVATVEEAEVLSLAPLANLPAAASGASVVAAALAAAKAAPAASSSSSSSSSASAAKASKPAKEGGAAAEAAPAAAEGGGSKKDKKKEKAAAGGGSGGAAAPAPAAAEADEAGRSPISMCDFRVGRILKAWKHESATSLYCEQIDLGEASGPREIASGLVAHYPSADLLVGRLVVVAANLKPRPLMGFMSNGMVLCASDAGKTKVVLLEVPEGTPLGERVAFAGHAGEPATPQQMTKKKILEAVFPGLKVNDQLQATYEGVPFMTSKGPVTIKDETLKGGNIA